MFALLTDVTGVSSNQRVGIRLVNFRRISAHRGGGEAARASRADCSVFPSGGRELFSDRVPGLHSCSFPHIWRHACRCKAQTPRCAGASFCMFEFTSSRATHELRLIKGALTPTQRSRGSIFFSIKKTH